MAFIDLFRLNEKNKLLYIFVLTIIFLFTDLNYAFSQSQNELATIAEGSRYSSGVRRRAINKLDPVIWKDLLVDIAKNDENWEIRIEAVEKLTDQQILTRIAKNDKANYVRIAAAEKINNQNFLADFLKQYCDIFWECKELIAKITDQKILADIFIAKTL